MKAHLLTTDTEINKETGFRCITVYLDNRSYEPHYHDYYELFLTLSDGVVHVINGQEELLPKGALCFIRKEDRHFFKPNCSNECSMVNLAFTQEILKNLFVFLSERYPSKELLKAKNPPMIVLGSVGIKQIMTRLDKINAGPIDDYHKSIGYKKFLATVFCEYFHDYPFEKKLLQMPSWLRDFEQKLKKSEYLSMPNDQIAELSGKSKEYLSRMIRKYFDVPFSEYINEIRLNYVANCLMDTDLPITQLFFEAGFENLSYGYVLFKKKFGVTPKIMRENIK